MIESKWDPMRKKLVRRLLEEHDKVLRSHFAQKGGARSQEGDRVTLSIWQGSGTSMSRGNCVREKGAQRAHGPGLSDRIVIKGKAWKLGFVSDFLWFS